MSTTSTIFSDVLAISNTVGDVSVTIPSGTTAVLIRKMGAFAGFSSATATGTSTVMGWTHTSGYTALAAVVFPEAGGSGGSAKLRPWFFA